MGVKAPGAPQYFNLPKNNFTTLLLFSCRVGFTSAGEEGEDGGNLSLDPGEVGTNGPDSYSSAPISYSFRNLQTSTVGG